MDGTSGQDEDPRTDAASGAGADDAAQAEGGHAGAHPDFPPVARDLEIPAILAMVEERCASAAGGEALPRRPLATRSQAEAELERIWQCRRARSLVGGLRFACDASLEEVEQVAAPGFVLPPRVLLRVWDGFCSVADAAEQLGEEREGFEAFAAEVEALPDLPDFRRRCARTFDERGDILDDASPALRELRTRQRELEGRIDEALQRVIQGEQRQYLSEEFVTRRDGRWVIPLASHFKGRIPGVVVGASGTGATLYVEPFKVVELSNDRQAAQAEEAKEIRRILQELTGMLRQHLGEVRTMIEGVAALDALHARAAFADRLDCQAVEFGDDSRLELRRARHLLLGEDCVPVDLSLPGEARGLVLSGANAGGKTVALKIVGTVVYLACAGYHVPVAEGCRVPFPRRIACVIGDDQSLEHHLSSFSSHVQNVVGVLTQAGAGDLVLLDELMSGTDPEEGAMLAVEVLRELARRGALTVTTTHYTPVKSLPEEGIGFVNASVEFDPRELRPTFRILVGEAGPSRGFEIATRFGLSAPIVERARERLGPERARMQGLMERIEEDRHAAAEARAEAEARQAELEKARAELEELRRKERREARALAEERASAFDERVTELRRQVLDAVEQGRLSDAARVVEQAAGAPVEVPEEPEGEAWRRLKEGDRVRVGGYGVVGTIRELTRDGRRAVIDTGTMTFEVEREKLEREDQTPPRPPRSGHRGRGGGSRREDSRGGRKKERSPRGDGELRLVLECMLVGKRAEEARETLEVELDRAVAEGADALRVIHGFGTGVLRSVTDEVLRSHPRVAKARPGGEHEGGRGATVAILD